MAPAREVGGDLYDFFRLDERRLFFLVGDVAGKGLSASIFMAVSKALYKSTALRAPEAAIGELMRAANEEVSRDNPEMFFVTAFAGVLDLESGDLGYCNAGHENPYLLDPGRSLPARLEQGGGPPLCVVDDFEYRGAMHRMRPGELLCVVTDGVLDSRNAAGERYGGGRFHELLRSLSDAPTAPSVVESITSDVAAFVGGAEPSDDITVLAMRWAGRSATH
jgi:serine phosphatase RsbU (regulator of sigma subunit)